MSSILLINASGRETRVALVDQGHIAEFYLERKKDRGIVGNVYKGRVTRVLPGMQAAFVDIGLDKAAFLYVGDVLFDPNMSRHQFELTEGEQDDEVPDVPDENEEGFPAADATPPAGAGGDGGPAANDDVSGEAEFSGPAEPEPAPREEATGPEAANDLEIPPERPSAPRPPAMAAAQPTDESESPPVAELLGVRPPPAAAPTPKSSSEPATDLAAAPTPPDGAPAGAGRLDAPSTNAPKDARPRERDGRQRERDRDRRKSEGPKKQARIEDLLKVGQEVLVQISKDPIGTKGARLTTHISIPGRHLVFMPTVDHVGISRRIPNEKERRRLREIVDSLRPPGTGFIVRTVAENVPREKLEADIRFLIEVWNETVRKSEKNHRPGLLHPDLDLILRATRDLFAQDVEKLILDDLDEYERVRNFVGAQDPELKDRVVLHTDEEPIFDAYGIEEEIRRATARKVWLKSGGYLIVDQAEALTAIDVNSGRYVGKKNLEDTITKINVEAAKEIVYQLRLRNIGGIIICDFIDMEKQQNRDKVFKALQEAMGRDKAKTNVLRISELGLVEMTRKRVRESIGRVLHEECGYCGGEGYVKTASTVAYEIFRELRRSSPAYKDPTLIVQCQTEVANVLMGEEREELRHLMDRFNKSIQVRARTDYHREQYDVYARPVSGVEIKVATTGAEFEQQVHASARKPGTNEARFDRGGDVDRNRNRGRGNEPRSRDRDNRDRGNREGGENRDGREGRGNQERRERDNRNNRDNRGGQEGRENRGGQEGRENRGGQEGRENRGGQEGRENRGGQEGRENRGGQQGREHRGNRGNQDGRDNRESKVSQPERQGGEPVTATPTPTPTPKGPVSESSGSSYASFADVGQQPAAGGTSQE
jgi:ribonuclease G